MVVLETSKLFSGLAPAELDLLKKAVRVQEFKSGEVIFKEGDEGDGIYVIQAGGVEISALIDPSERRSLAQLGPGDFFGEMAVLDNEPRSATVAAKGETVVHFIPRAELLRMLESSPRLAVSLVREFSLRMRDVNRRYIEEVLRAERLTLVGRFARSIVHDFKNPLNVIGIAAELGLSETATLEKRRTAQLRIRKQVDRLSNMISELLEFTRGSQGSIVLGQTNYREYIRQLTEEMRPEMEDKQVLVRLENEPPELWVLLDPVRLSHLVYNLAHNGVDAMPEGGELIFRFAVTPSELITEIEDTGAGIAPEIAPRIFEAFATFGKVQGTGLGLSICRRIIEDHGGRIEARNSARGGAVFSFALPLSR